MFGIIFVILITLVSFAYLIPENSTATDVVQASATGTTTSVTSASVVNSSSELTTTNAVHTTHTTKVRTMTSTSTVSTALTTTTTTTSSSESTTTTVTTTTAESTTVSSEIQTSTEPVVITSAETSVSETVLTATEITTEPVIILTEESQNEEYDEYNHIHDDYCGCDNDYSDDYDYDYDESEISSGERTYLGTFRITHYCPCASCCGEYTGLTASGTYATAGRTISASSRFDFGTKLEIDGIVYTVEDRGGFAENTIDIFCDSHDEALEKGTYYADVYIVE